MLQEARLEGFANLEGACTTRRKLTYVRKESRGALASACAGVYVMRKGLNVSVCQGVKIAFAFTICLPRFGEERIDKS